MILLIDDMRVYDDADCVCRTFSDGVKSLQKESWDKLYLDYDLGTEESGESGYEIACFIVKNIQHAPRQIQFVTCNIHGQHDMELVISEFYVKIDEVNRLWELK